MYDILRRDISLLPASMALFGFAEKGLTFLLSDDSGRMTRMRMHRPRLYRALLHLEGRYR